jgi:peptidoglycan/xylan/chitin deacetylase (PgdA/CDA1 family)
MKPEPTLPNGVRGRLPLWRLLLPPGNPPACGHFFEARLPVPLAGEWMVPFLLSWAVAAAGSAALMGWGWFASTVAGLTVLHVLVLAGAAGTLTIRHRFTGTVIVHGGLLVAGWLAWRSGGALRAVAATAALFWAANGLAWLWIKARESVRGSVMLFGALHALPVAAGLAGGAGWAAATVLALGVLFTGSTFLHGAWLFGVSLRGFPTARREICLTIDDGPCADTPEVLALLAERGQRAVFFLIGDRAEQHPEEVRRIVAAGHAIANHTQSHPAHWFWSYTPRALRREMSRCQETLTRLTGMRPRLFRAPVGFYNPFCHAVAAEQQLTCVGWRGYSRDGVCGDVDLILSRLRKGLRPGGILLIHQGRPHSLAVLQRLLELLDREGWTLTIPAPWDRSPPSGEKPQASC